MVDHARFSKWFEEFWASLPAKGNVPALKNSFKEIAEKAWTAGVKAERKDNVRILFSRRDFE